MRTRRIAGLVGAVAGAVIGISALAVFLVTNTDWGRAQVRTRALRALATTVHGSVSVGRVSGNLLRGVELHDVRITDSAGAPFVHASRVHVGYALRALVARRLDFRDVLIDSATIVLARDESGWNYDRIFPTDSTPQAASAPGFGDWIVLRDVTLRRSRLLVRTPWRPDSTLHGAARDSAVRAALDGATRTVVSRTVNGRYDQTQDFREIDAALPLIRLADPAHRGRLVRVDSLRMQAFAFAPPAASIRQLRGEFELDGDSLWFRDIALTLPRSQATLTGRYAFVHGDLALRVRASPVALGDVRFLYPPLPHSGTATGAIAVQWENGLQQYDVQSLDLATGGASITGSLSLTIGERADDLVVGPTALRLAALPTDLIERLVPGLALPRQGILDGRAALRGPTDSLQVDADITFTDDRSGRSRMLAMGELGAVHGVFRAQRLRVSFAPLQMDLVRVAFDAFPIGGVLNGRATLDGESDDVLRATGLRAMHREGSESSRVSGSIAVRSGRSGNLETVDARLSAAPVSLRTIGRLSPAAQLRGSVRGNVAAVGPLNALAVDADLRTPDGGRLMARGTLDLSSGELGYAMDIRTERLDLRMLSQKAPRTSLSAFLQTRARGTTPNTVRGTFAADIGPSSADTVALDSMRVRATIQDGVLRLRDSWLRAPGMHLETSGVFGVADGASGALQWRATVDSLSQLARYLPPSDTTEIPTRPLRTAERIAAARRDSAAAQQRLAVARMAGEEPPATPVHVDSVPGVRGDSLAGAVSARGSLTGGMSGFDLSGVLDALGVVVKGNSVRRARAELQFTGVLTKAPRYGVSMTADSLLTSGFALDSVSARIEHSPPGGTAELAIFQSDARDYGLRASYALYPDRREVLWRTLRLRFDSTTWESAHPGGVRWGQPGVFIDSLDLRSKNEGRIFADGRAPNEGPIDLRLVVNNFRLGDMLGLLQSDLEARGTITVNATLTGTGRAPILTGEARLEQARYRDTPVPSVTSLLRYAEEHLGIRARLTDSAHGPDRPVAELDATLPVNLALFGVTAPRVLDLPAKAEVQIDSLPLDLLARVTTALQAVRGTADGRVALSGTLRKPRITGAVALRDARAYVTALGVTAERMNGTIRLNSDTVRLDSLVAWSDGRIVMRGIADISTPAKPVVDLALDVLRARVLDNEQGRVRADAAITARGPLDAVLVQGRTRIREGILYLPESDNREVISVGDPSVFAVIDTTDIRTRELLPTQSPLLANLRLDLTLGVDRDTWVRSRDANIEIYSEEDLDIRVDRRRSTLTLDGVVNTDRGEYQLLGKRFQVKRGAVQFVGTQEINPLLQITGEYEVKQASRPALNISILIGGTLRSPRLTLESDAQPPISQTDLLSYLAFGSESGSLMQFGSSSLSGGSTGGNLVGTSAALATRQLTGVALGVAVEELEGQAARSLGADVLNITPANVPPELASGNFGALSTFLRGTRFEFGKYLNTRTFLGVQLQATTTPGFRVERQLGRMPGLSLESTFQPRFFLPEPSLNEQEITKANAFGLFLRKRWRF